MSSVCEVHTKKGHFTENISCEVFNQFLSRTDFQLLEKLSIKKKKEYFNWFVINELIFIF